MTTRKWSDDVVGWVAPFALLIMVGGGIVLGWQCFEWLRTGSWHELPIAEVFGWDTDAIKWGGVRKMAEIIGSLGLALFLVLAPLFTLLGVMTLLDHIEAGQGKTNKS